MPAARRPHRARDLPVDVLGVLFGIAPADALLPCTRVCRSWSRAMAVLAPLDGPPIGGVERRLGAEGARRLRYLRALGLVRPSPGRSAVAFVKEEAVSRYCVGDVRVVVYPRPFPATASPDELANMAAARAGDQMERAVVVRQGGERREFEVASPALRVQRANAHPFEPPELRETVTDGGFVDAFCQAAVELGHTRYDGMGYMRARIEPFHLARVGKCMVAISRGMTADSARLLAFSAEPSWRPLWSPESAATANALPVAAELALFSVSPDCAVVYTSNHPFPFAPVPANERRRYGSCMVPALLVWWSRLFGLRVVPLPDYANRNTRAGWQVVPGDAVYEGAVLCRFGCPPHIRPPPAD